VLLCFIAGLSLTEATGVTNVRGTVIRILTPDGTLVVEVDDPGVKVTIEGDGGLVITGTGLHEVRLKPGSYKLQADKDGASSTRVGHDHPRRQQVVKSWIGRRCGEADQERRPGGKAPLRSSTRWRGGAAAPLATSSRGRRAVRFRAHAADAADHPRW
jgi:hypothetical protein